jgi:hypothetical protein
MMTAAIVTAIDDCTISNNLAQREIAEAETRGLVPEESKQAICKGYYERVATAPRVHSEIAIGALGILACLTGRYREWS